MWKLKTSERVARWRDFRKTLNTLPLEDALRATIDFWHGCPFAPYYLDPDQPKKWPSPWELISENYYCDLAKALGMLYTLYLSDHKPLDIELSICVDSVDRQVYNLVSLAKGKYILNFSFNEVVNKKQLPKTLTVQHRYGAQDLNLDLY